MRTSLRGLVGLSGRFWHLGRRGLVGILALVLPALAARHSAAGDFDVVINEIGYNPWTEDPRDEFVELLNAGPTPVNLAGWGFTEGIAFFFTDDLYLGPGEALVVSPDVERTREHYGLDDPGAPGGTIAGVRVVGPYEGRLDNDGEILTLRSSGGSVIHRVHYKDGGAWPSHPDGLGPTLELVDPRGGREFPNAWASSLVLEGTPGLPNSRAIASGPDGPAAWRAEERKRTVVINEVGPSVPAGSGFVELYNRTAAPLDVGGYVIADSRGSRYTIPGPRTVAAGGRLLLAEAQLGFPVVLSNTGIALLEEDGATWVDGVNPHAAPESAGAPEASFGRFPDGDEDQFVMVSPTPGTPNELVRETSVVVNEILYHPVFVEPSGDCYRQCSDADQWIELHNRGPSAVDVGGWTLSKGVELAIPDGTLMPAGGYLVLAADRSRFLARHPTVDPTRVLGPWTKSLSRNADTINLNEALGNRVDHVEYGNGDPTNDVEPADGVDDRTIASSDWPSAAHDGTQGRSLELVHPGLDNRAGAAWRAGPPGGTPAAPNAAHTGSPAPVVWDVAHEPPVPRSDEAVRVTCRVSSLSPVQAVEAIWRLDPSATTSTVALRDDGLSGDRDAADGIYGGTIPPQANRSVVAFQVRARAQDGQTHLVPRSPQVAPYTGFRGPYFLYEVDDAEPLVSGRATAYRIVMTGADLDELLGRSLQSDELLPCTFIGNGKVRHGAGIRIRGKGSRSFNPHPWRIDLPPERTFEGLERLNLVSPQVETEIVASSLFRRAGMPCSQEWLVDLTFRGIGGSGRRLYFYKEAYDSRFRDRHFGGASDGNLYRAYYTLGPGVGDLRYYGPTVNEQYRTAYDKRTNEEEDDYSDVIALCAAFDRTATPDSEFVARLDSLIDAEEWALFFAVQSCLSNVDGGIQSGSGEDYFLYRVPEDSHRPDRGKFLLLPWDMSETFRDAEERLFRPSLPAVRRFLTHPEFAPLYYAKLIELRDGAFSRMEMRKSASIVSEFFDAARVAALTSDYVARRVEFYEENIPGALTAGAAEMPPVVLVEVGDEWRFFRGESEPSGGTADWSEIAFDDGSWESGPTGIGYDDGDDATELLDMEGRYTTVYARRAFTVSDPSAILSLRLEVDFDDGFVAYLNGAEIARRNAPGDDGSFVRFDAVATASHAASVEGGAIHAGDVTAFRDRLVAGKNVLAAMVLNSSRDSSDLSFIPRLLSTDASVGGAGCGDLLIATGPTLGLAGASNAGLTRSVLVGGQPASYDGFTGLWRGSASGLAAGLNEVEIEAFSGPEGLGALVESRTVSILRISGGLRPVTGAVSGSETWRAADGPYRMVGSVTVPAGATLAIEAGTIVLAEAGASLIVRGRLEANGTKAAPIVFRPMACEGRWGGIALVGTGVGDASPTHVLRSCELAYALDASGFAGCISAVDAKVIIEDCDFGFLSADAIRCDRSRVEVRRSGFEDIRRAIHAVDSVLLVADSTFRETRGNTSAIRIDSAGAGRSRIEGSLLERCSGIGIELAAASVDVAGTTVRFAADRGILASGDGPLGPFSLTSSVIEGCGTGLAIANGADVSAVDHATIVGNQVGIRLYRGSGAGDGGHAAVDSAILWDNTVDVSVDGDSTLSFTYSDLGSEWPGEGNIAAAPRFLDPYRSDFRLSPESPAIASGRDGTDMGAFPFTGELSLFIRGDADSDGAVDLTDAVVILSFLFRGEAIPECLDRADANDDGSADIADPVYLLLHLFLSGPQPPVPFPIRGLDPTPDALPCPPGS